MYLYSETTIFINVKKLHVKILTIRRHKIFAKTASCGNLETTKIHPLVKNRPRHERNMQ